MWRCELRAQEAVPAPSHVWGLQQPLLLIPGIAGWGTGESCRGERQLWLSKAALSCFLLVLDGAGWVPQDKHPQTGPAEPPVVNREAGTFPRGWTPLGAPELQGWAAKCSCEMPQSAEALQMSTSCSSLIGLDVLPAWAVLWKHFNWQKSELFPWCFPWWFCYPLLTAQHKF